MKLYSEFEVFIMKIAVSVESTNDLTKELLEQYDIKVIPYQIILGDQVYKDGEITTTEIFEYVNKTGVLPKTNAINQYEYTEYFESLKKEYDAVVHICLSKRHLNELQSHISLVELIYLKWLNQTC